MHAVYFNKSFATAALEAIKTGKPIPAPPQGWSGNHMLMLAGILSAAVFSQGPQKERALGLSMEKLATLHSEHREAVNATLEQDIHSAIDFVSMLTFKVIDTQYDAECDPEVTALVYQQADGGKALIPLSGFANKRA